jgi:hypothetical protein
MPTIIFWKPWHVKVKNNAVCTKRTFRLYNMSFLLCLFNLFVSVFNGEFFLGYQDCFQFFINHTVLMCTNLINYEQD